MGTSHFNSSKNINRALKLLFEQYFTKNWAEPLYHYITSISLYHLHTVQYIITATVMTLNLVKVKLWHVMSPTFIYSLIHTHAKATYCSRMQEKSGAKLAVWLGRCWTRPFFAAVANGLGVFMEQFYRRQSLCQIRYAATGLQPRLFCLILP